jgi:predicted transcriptional regulator YdeE
MIKEPEINKLHEMKLIGYPYYGINKRIPEMWERFMKYFPQISDYEQSYGFMCNFGHNREPWEFFYMPAVEVESLDAGIPMELVGKTVPASRWAMFPTTIELIHETINFIQNEWLPGSGFTYSMNAELEIYPKNCEKTGIFYCLPVKEK